MLFLITVISLFWWWGTHMQPCGCERTVWRNYTTAIRLGNRCLYLLSHLTGSQEWLNSWCFYLYLPRVIFKDLYHRAWLSWNYLPPKTILFIIHDLNSMGKVRSRKSLMVQMHTLQNSYVKTLIPSSFLHVCAPCVQCPRRPEEGSGYPETGRTATTLPISLASMTIFRQRAFKVVIKANWSSRSRALRLSVGCDS